MISLAISRSGVLQSLHWNSNTTCLVALLTLVRDRDDAQAVLTNEKSPCFSKSCAALTSENVCSNKAYFYFCKNSGQSSTNVFLDYDRYIFWPNTIRQAHKKTDAHKQGSFETQI